MYANPNHSPTVRFILSSLLIILVSLAVLAAVPKPAHAWSYTPVSGTRGNVSVPTIFVGDYYYWDGYNPGGWKANLRSHTGPVAYRSTASAGSQIVQAIYLLEQWDGSKWVIVSKSPLYQRQIGATQTYAQFPVVNLLPLTARGHFRLTWAFDWYTTNGALLGSTYVHSSYATDHVCDTSRRLCQSYAGYFRTGGFGTGTW